MGTVAAEIRHAALVIVIPDPSSESGIHYDESLGSWDKYGTISNTFIVQSWQPWD